MKMAELAPKKRRSSSDKPSWNKCLCHVVDKANGRLTTFTEQSWYTFHKCSNSRRDEIWMIMKNFWGHGPKGGYHRQCYQKYTNKNKVAKAEMNQIYKTEDETKRDESLESSPKRVRRSQLPNFDLNKCVICQKDKIQKSIKGLRTREPLTLNISEYGSTTLAKAAKLQNDTRLLLNIEGKDTIAMEVKYHRSCYKDYVRVKEIDKSCQEKNDEECYDRAFSNLKETVNVEIITKSRAIPMSDLLDDYVKYLAEHGISAPSYSSSKLKSRLIRCFGQKLSFRSPVSKNQSEIVYSSQVNVGEVIEAFCKNINADGEHSENEEIAIEENRQNESYQVYHAAKIIRNLLSDVKPTMNWPPSPDDLNSGSAMIPKLVYNLFAWILSSHSKYSEERVSDLSPDVNRLVLSFSQDLVHSVSRGRVKTPKHVVLPMTVKSLTGSVELITILNKFGHGLSYSLVEELETALAETQLARQQNDTLIPSACSLAVPGIFCWDNNDLLEETLSGKGTTHCTNGIVIQRKPHTCALPPNMSAHQPRTKNRSVKNVTVEVLPFTSSSRKEPSPVKTNVNSMITLNHQVCEYAKKVDLGWMLCRLPVEDTLFNQADNQKQVIPAWTGFNTMLQEKKVPRECSIGYCQVIDASPTELPTVNTVLKQSMKMADQLGQNDVIVVFDQAIYAKALEIIWQDHDQFKCVVLRLGTFHTICAFLAAIGKRFGDAGLTDILVESEIVGSGSVSGVIEGRHYNRALRTHKIVYEALHRLQWLNFKSWLQAHGHPVNYAMVVQVLTDVRKNFNADKFNDLLLMNDFEKLSHLYREYCKEDNGPMKSFWNSYLEMVDVLLRVVRATREGNWEMHLEGIKEMLPWFFAYDHINYARYLPVYLSDMLVLQDTHPEAYSMLVNGDFGVQRSHDHGFSQVPIDQTIEQTLNRSTKTKGGIVGFSVNKAAVQRWLLTAHSRAVYVDKCRSMTSGSTETRLLHKESGHARMKRDEDDVIKVMEVIQNWRNPFIESEELVSISSGRSASKEVEEDLLKAKEKGKDALVLFTTERLIKKSKGFFDPITKLKLGTFRDAQVKTSLKAGGKNIIVKADRNLFARLLVIGQSRKVDLRELLAHELGPLPWALALFDGSLTKTNKAVLPKLLEDGAHYLNDLPADTTAIMIDAMALLQSLVQIPDRFGMLAEMVLKKLLAVSREATRIDFIGDQYPDISIKNTERDQRTRSGNLRVTVTSPQQLCPRQWKKFMSLGSNKTSLLKFLVKEWSSNQKYALQMQGRTVFVTHGETCTSLSSEDNCTINADLVEELFTDQEEADTRIFLHAFHASRDGHTTIAIQSSDTDVEVMACYYQNVIKSQLLLVSGNKTRSRIINIPSLCGSLCPEICKVLPSLHALTGCDTVSSFATKGKTKALAVLQSSQELRVAVEALGERIPFQEDFNKLEKFVCVLYNDHTCTQVNDLRYKMFCKTKNVQSHQLPPSKAALEYHFKRANYQAYIWKHALVAKVGKSPQGQGWEIKDNNLKIRWTDLLPAPKAVMSLVSCNCKKGCKTQRCSCVSNALRCTDACGCEQCENDSDDLDNPEEEDDDGDDDIDDY